MALPILTTSAARAILALTAHVLYEEVERLYESGEELRRELRKWEEEPYQMATERHIARRHFLSGEGEQLDRYHGTDDRMPFDALLSSLSESDGVGERSEGLPSLRDSINETILSLLTRRPMYWRPPDGW
jgi:hypothetical protein